MKIFVKVHIACTAQLKASNSDTSQFKKRVTWVEKTENIMSEISNNIAIVKYIGYFPERQCYGSVKEIDKNVKYIRTKPRVVRHLESKVKHRSVKDVEREENNVQTSDFEKQRNKKQLRNMLYKFRDFNRRRILRLDASNLKMTRF
ncbi:hypothetical protein DPMN_068490 [Dreissena polymorpha]|uniref:Uncharacterized protein n=1 Tax=Dreissena polymorpha TaxID=45954 RepID=A0A9D3Z1R2_DREPO|nr:hypothetical protein DPMN_068490 [Dreissena polymorpha]